MLVNLLRRMQKYPKIYSLFTKLFNLLGVKRKVKGLNNVISINDTILFKTKITIIGNDNEITIGKNSKLRNCKIEVQGDGHKLHIGDNCILNNTIFTFTNSNCRTTLGSKTTINGALIYTGESQFIEIGEDCMFSSKIDIRTTDSHSILSLDSRERINTAQSIKIGNHVWLGNGCRVWKGAVIGDHSIIGTGSIVTKEIEKNCVAVGTPAKTIKHNVTWIRELIKS